MNEIDIYGNFRLRSKSVEDESERYKEYRCKWEDLPIKHIVEDFPIHVDLEMNTTCNLKCPMCTYSKYPPKPIIGDLDLAKKVIDEGVKKGLCSIKTQFRGEPLLYGKMPELIKYAKEKGVIEAMFNTNATLLSKEKAKALIEAGLDKIICSVDGFTKEVYESVRVGGNFETVLENIKTLQNLKKEMGSIKPIVRVQMINAPYNNYEAEDYINFWDKIVEQIGVEDLTERLTFADIDTPLEDWSCSQLWQRVVVLADGDIVPCCGGVIKGDIKMCVLGNAYKDSIEDVWKGKDLTKLRKLHIEGRSHEIEMCRRCTIRQYVLSKKLEGKS
ncbi:MAG: radical SAM/SPASM domain-containing protein [Promethearchaeota archaeon]